jgi:hypothetical protein
MALTALKFSQPGQPSEITKSKSVGGRMHTDRTDVRHETTGGSSMTDTYEQKRDVLIAEIEAKPIKDRTWAENRESRHLRLEKAAEMAIYRDVRELAAKKKESEND